MAGSRPALHSWGVPLLILVAVGALIVALGIAIAPYLGWIIGAALILGVLGLILAGVMALVSAIVDPIHVRLRPWADGTARPEVSWNFVKAIGIILAVVALFVAADRLERWTCVPGYAHLEHCRAR